MRRDVNGAVSCRVKSSARAFEGFTQLVNDGLFKQQLREAMDDSASAAARAVIRKVARFVHLAGKSVPWGPRERAGEFEKSLALHRSEGSASIFYSCAPVRHAWM